MYKIILTYCVLYTFINHNKHFCMTNLCMARGLKHFEVPAKWDSSISTIFPNPPSFGLFAQIHFSHTSLHFAYQFTTVLQFFWPKLQYCLHWFSVKLCTKCQTIHRIVWIGRWLFPKKVPSRIENLPLLHLPYSA